MEHLHSGMGGRRTDERLAALRVMWRGQQSNYGMTKDRYRAVGRGSGEEGETEKKKRNGAEGVVTCWSLHHAMVVNQPLTVVANTFRSHLEEEDNCLTFSTRRHICSFLLICH